MLEDFLGAEWDRMTEEEREEVWRIRYDPEEQALAEVRGEYVWKLLLELEMEWGVEGTREEVVVAERKERVEEARREAEGGGGEGLGDEWVGSVVGLGRRGL